MPQPQVPKYQAIYAHLRQQILDGEYAAGERLPPQQDLADTFGVTLMTLRQAVSTLEADGLVWAARGKGTFVSDRPVDISIGNLSSFAQQMSLEGIEVKTELLEVQSIPAVDHPLAAGALDVGGAELRMLLRRRSIEAEPFSLQRSYLAAEVGVDLADEQALGRSLYGAIEKATGWSIAEALESVTAVGLSVDDALLLDAAAGHPALLSIRTSVNQFGQPYLYDEALLVGGRCSIAANRSADRLSLDYRVEQ